jgi:hypothetical protein
MASRPWRKANTVCMVYFKFPGPGIPGTRYDRWDERSTRHRIVGLDRKSCALGDDGHGSEGIYARSMCLGKMGKDYYGVTQW